MQCAWSGCGGDAGMFSSYLLSFFSALTVTFYLPSIDGWVYTNDAWLNSRAVPYVSDGGSVTRRRRWVRRIWYDPERVEEEEGGELG